MSLAALTALCAIAAATSLAASWVLVSRLERIGARLGASEAVLGLMAALAADTPEVTTAVTALAHHEHAVGTGVIIGASVFNLAALLGFGAVVAGRIALHRRLVVAAGTLAVWVATVCLLTVGGWVPPLAGLLLVLAVLVPYTALAAWGVPARARTWAPRASRWLMDAVSEDPDRRNAIQVPRGGVADGLVAAGALGAVLVASVVMERAAAAAGGRAGVAGIVTGGLVLAAVTSLPNAVAAVYLARRGRGEAALSTALNSNAINVAAGFLLPSTLLGPGRPDGLQVFTGGWNVGLTCTVFLLAYLGRGLSRAAGLVVICSYACFAGLLIVAAQAAA